MLRICPVDVSRTNSFLSVDPTKKVVTVYDPANSGYVLPSHRRNGVTAPKMFGFDGVFSQDDSLVGGSDNANFLSLQIHADFLITSSGFYRCMNYIQDHC